MFSKFSTSHLIAIGLILITLPMALITVPLGALFIFFLPVAIGIWKEKQWTYILGFVIFVLFAVGAALLNFWLIAFHEFKDLEGLAIVFTIPTAIWISTISAFAAPSLWRILRQKYTQDLNRTNKEFKILRILFIVVVLLNIVSLPLGGDVRAYRERQVELQKIREIKEGVAQLKADYNLLHPIYFPPKVFDPETQPEFIESSGNLKEKVINAKLYTTYYCDENYSSRFQIQQNPPGKHEQIQPGFVTNPNTNVTLEHVIEEIDILGNKGIFATIFSLKSYTQTRAKVWQTVISWINKDSIQIIIRSDQACILPGSEKEELLKVAKSMKFSP